MYGLYDAQNERDACGVSLIANVKGNADHRTISDALEALRRLAHRGATGDELETGDGAGILTAIPHKLFADEIERLFTPPHKVEKGRYGVGIVFLPHEEIARKRIKDAFEVLVAKHKQILLGWRPVPLGQIKLGRVARAGQPVFEQVFIQAAESETEKSFERKLYLIRKQAAHMTYKNGGGNEHKVQPFYICSLSSRTIVYKGQLTCAQLGEFYLDLQDESYQSHFALVHSRFATNTLPSWERAQPNRITCHNGEINTLRGNVNWMKAREGALRSCAFGGEEGTEAALEFLASAFPVVEPNLSDSGSFDCVLDFLVQTGRELPEAILMMIPEAWQNDELMSPEKKAFYKYHSCLMEPWDGPAMFGFSDARYAGAVLDRNGLRPSRVYVTRDDRVILGSEVGVLDVDPAQVLYKTRLEPGKIFLIDFEEGRIIGDEEFKNKIATAHPYGQWLEEELIPLDRIAGGEVEIPPHDDSQLETDPRVRAFNFSEERLKLLVQPMGLYGGEALGSMGNDEALACLSAKPRIVYDYFHQLFAQVTNPPIDPIREGIVMSLECMIGPEGNILEVSRSHCHRLQVKTPILSMKELHVIKSVDKFVPDWKSKVIDLTWERSEAEEGLAKAIDRICAEAEGAVDGGYQLIILSDRNVSEERVPASALLACGAVHHHLIQHKKRGRLAIVLETGEAREVHHMAVLLGFGADAICPYLVYDCFAKMLAGHTEQDILPEELKGIDMPALVDNYIYACAKGIRKIMAKMGISTLQSYKGAQIFECVGLGPEVVDKCFVGVASRLKGVGFKGLAAESLAVHAAAYRSYGLHNRALDSAGQFHWRAEGEHHLLEPEAIAALQEASKTNSRASFKNYTSIINKQSDRGTIRGLLEFKKEGRTPVPLEEVEPASEIVKRFVTGAMSFGSISWETHTTLAQAMNKIGGKSNTGEGGEDPERFGDTRNSAIKQVASGRFGVTIHYLTNAVELQIKMAQGAKPGEGGELPGDKVVGHIATTRHSTPGVGLISPPPHHDIYSIEDLKQLIYDLKNANPSARISVKLVSEVGVGTIAAGVAKALADHILISGFEGGTGASSWTGIKHAGLPWELGLAETHQTLVLNDLRGRVVLQTDGGMRTGRDVIHAALLGAEEMGFGTVPLITLGCIMMRKCHLNTCPVGVATQDPELRKKFKGQPEHVVNYFFLVAEEVREIMAELGFRKFQDMVGRSDLLVRKADFVEKTKYLDLAPITKFAHELRPDAAVYNVKPQNHALEEALDNTLLHTFKTTIAECGRSGPSHTELSIKNTDRTVGTMLSSHITKMFGAVGLPDETIHIKFNGSAGQSFGAFLCSGVTLELEGDSNDYVGKGLSGGRVIVYPHRNSNFEREENVIVGNVCFYGATEGEGYIRGRAAERFCVRNSGASAVVEGVGDHGCEYMTGGKVVVLGSTGRNFAAGMSGGVAYVWDVQGTLPNKCNMEMVAFEPLDAEDIETVKTLVSKHVQHTSSPVGKRLLDGWEENAKRLVKVMPKDYRKALDKLKNQPEFKEKEEEPKKPAEPPVKDIEEVVPVGRQAKVMGFKTYKRKEEEYREPEQRMNDFEEIFSKGHDTADRKKQASRCMDCGVPFCQSETGCPINNLIPEWNDLVYRGQWKLALERLLKTNNFPEFTGRVCPAPCEGACTLGLIDSPVTIKNIEKAIIDRGYSEGWIVPHPPSIRTGKKVAVIGSGPAGLAAADQLNKAGHWVTVYEKADRIGGLLIYGIPNMKLDKSLVKRRLDIMEQEGVKFVTNAHVGVNVDADTLYEENDAILLACGSTLARDLPIPGRNLKGIHQAMDFLTASTKQLLSVNNAKDVKSYSESLPEEFNAKGKRVIVIGGGDTGNDCIGTSVRQMCAGMTNFEILPQPPNERAEDNPWPQWPKVLRIDYGHEEAALKLSHNGKEDPRQYRILSKEFIGDEATGTVTGIKTTRVRWTKNKDDGRWVMAEEEGSEFTFPCDMVLLSMGFVGPEKTVAQHLNVDIDGRMGTFKAEFGAFRTSREKVFAAGDCRRGQSLVVWAIREGRDAAKAISSFLDSQK